jgi:hypothetical protein
MREVLAGTAISVTDFGKVRAGDKVTIVVDGWHAEQLTLAVTEIRQPLDHTIGVTWLYGIDGCGHVRLVLARCAAPTVIGRAPVRPAAQARTPVPYPPSWDSNSVAAGRTNDDQARG